MSTPRMNTPNMQAYLHALANFKIAAAAYDSALEADPDAPHDEALRRRQDAEAAVSAARAALTPEESRWLAEDHEAAEPRP
jgi:hypothetical protein